MKGDERIGRRLLLMTATTHAVLFGCSQGTRSLADAADAGGPGSCAKDALGPGLPYCLTAKVAITIPGAARLAVGQVALMALDDHSSAIVARDEGGFYAMSATCTHACCTVAICSDSTCATPALSPNDCAPAKVGTLVRKGAAFLCPCHGSSFGADGAVINGPAQSRLPAVALAINGEDIVVDLSQPVSSDQRRA